MLNALREEAEKEEEEEQGPEEQPAQKAIDTNFDAQMTDKEVKLEDEPA